MEGFYNIHEARLVSVPSLPVYDFHASGRSAVNFSGLETSVPGVNEASMKECEERFFRCPLTTPAGLINVGESCFANCLLQTVYRVSKFRLLLFQFRTYDELSPRERDALNTSSIYSQSPPPTNRLDQDISIPVQTVLALRELFAQMMFSIRRSVSPGPLLSVFILSNRLRRYNFNRQEDPAEFWLALIALLAEGLNEGYFTHLDSRTGLTKVTKSSEDHQMKFIMSEIFQGVAKQVLHVPKSFYKCLTINSIDEYSSQESETDTDNTTMCHCQCHQSPSDISQKSQSEDLCILCNSFPIFSEQLTDSYVPGRYQIVNVSSRNCFGEFVSELPGELPTLLGSGIEQIKSDGPQKENPDSPQCDTTSETANTTTEMKESQRNNDNVISFEQVVLPTDFESIETSMAELRRRMGYCPFKVRRRIKKDKKFATDVLLVPVMAECKMIHLPSVWMFVVQSAMHWNSASPSSRPSTTPQFSRDSDVTSPTRAETEGQNYENRKQTDRINKETSHNPDEMETSRIPLSFHVDDCVLAELSSNTLCVSELHAELQRLKRQFEETESLSLPLSGTGSESLPVLVRTLSENLKLLSVRLDKVQSLMNHQKEKCPFSNLNTDLKTLAETSETVRNGLDALVKSGTHVRSLVSGGRSGLHTLRKASSMRSSALKVLSLWLRKGDRVSTGHYMCLTAQNSEEQTPSFTLFNDENVTKVEDKEAFRILNGCSDKHLVVCAALYMSDETNSAVLDEVAKNGSLWNHCADCICCKSKEEDKKIFGGYWSHLPLHLQRTILRDNQEGKRECQSLFELSEEMMRIKKAADTILADVDSRMTVMTNTPLFLSLISDELFDSSRQINHLAYEVSRLVHKHLTTLESAASDSCLKNFELVYWLALVQFQLQYISGLRIQVPMSEFLVLALRSGMIRRCTEEYLKSEVFAKQISEDMVDHCRRQIFGYLFFESCFEFTNSQSASPNDKVFLENSVSFLASDASISAIYLDCFSKWKMPISLDLVEICPPPFGQFQDVIDVNLLWDCTPWTPPGIELLYSAEPNEGLIFEKMLTRWCLTIPETLHITKQIFAGVVEYAALWDVPKCLFLISYLLFNSPLALIRSFCRKTVDAIYTAMENCIQRHVDKLPRSKKWDVEGIVNKMVGGTEAVDLPDEIKIINLILMKIIFSDPYLAFGDVRSLESRNGKKFPRPSCLVLRLLTPANGRFKPFQQIPSTCSNYDSNFVTTVEKFAEHISFPGRHRLMKLSGKSKPTPISLLTLTINDPDFISFSEWAIVHADCLCLRQGVLESDFKNEMDPLVASARKKQKKDSSWISERKEVHEINWEKIFQKIFISDGQQCKPSAESEGRVRKNSTSTLA